MSYSGGSTQKQWSASFHEVMNDDKGISMFKEFLKNEQAEHLLLFYLDLLHFHKAPSSELKKYARDIYNTYIVTKSPKAMSLLRTTKQELDNIFADIDKNEVTHATFDKAGQYIYGLLQEDYFKRFIRTPQYEAFKTIKNKKDTIVICKLPGEELMHKPIKAHLLLPGSKSYMLVDVFVTNFRITFGNWDTQSRSNNDLELLNEVCAIYLGAIHNIGILVKKNGVLMTEFVEIQAKDVRRIEFRIDTILSSQFIDALEPTKEFVKHIKNLAFPSVKTDLFAFCYKPSATTDASKGWQIYNVFEEFLRQQIDMQKWRFTNINHGFTKCYSYPETFVVPHDIQMRP
eukprot:TRINITY_DN6810_c0_g1_i1.p1 TRINITY_DN6810_c0_g1~~TRINITY_DN6810_c0_g1_i1.p1  ORF type:complete len:344 (-),score=63.63 TRINITY_DN6810_c0_g1_i1:95-1126(-)